MKLLITLFKEETTEYNSVQQNGDVLYQMVQRASLYTSE